MTKTYTDAARIHCDSDDAERWCRSVSLLATPTQAHANVVDALLMERYALTHPTEHTISYAMQAGMAWVMAVIGVLSIKPTCRNCHGNGVFITQSAEAARFGGWTPCEPCRGRGVLS